MHHLLHTCRMYDYLPMNATSARVLQIVKDNDGVNCESVASHFELGPNHIQALLKKMHQDNLIYIGSYKPDKRNCLRPMYMYGNEPDAPRPPIKYASERKQERLLEAKRPFIPRRDMASEWMTHL